MLHNISYKTQQNKLLSLFLNTLTDFWPNINANLIFAVKRYKLRLDSFNDELIESVQSHWWWALFKQQASIDYINAKKKVAWCYLWCCVIGIDTTGMMCWHSMVYKIFFLLTSLMQSVVLLGATFLTYGLVCVLLKKSCFVSCIKTWSCLQ